MALMDRMKAQATPLAQKAQEAGKAGASKLDDVQAKRKADALFRDLGAAVYAQHTGTGGDTNAADIERLIGELTSLETESGPINSTPAPASSTDAAADPGTTPDGGFKLD